MSGPAVMPGPPSASVALEDDDEGVSPGGATRRTAARRCALSAGIADDLGLGGQFIDFGSRKLWRSASRPGRERAGRWRQVTSAPGAPSLRPRHDGEFSTGRAADERGRISHAGRYRSAAFHHVEGPAEPPDAAPLFRGLTICVGLVSKAFD